MKKLAMSFAVETMDNFSASAKKFTNNSGKLLNLATSDK